MGCTCIYTPWRFLMSLIWSSKTFCRFRLAKTSSSSCFRNMKMLFSSVCKLFRLKKRRKRNFRIQFESFCCATPHLFGIQTSTKGPLHISHCWFSSHSHIIWCIRINKSLQSKMRLNLYIRILFLLFWAVLLVSQFKHDRYILPANFCVIPFKENQNY